MHGNAKCGIYPTFSTLFNSSGDTVPNAPPRRRRAAQPGFQPGRRHGPPLPSTDRPQAGASNIPANTMLGTESTGSANDLVRTYGRRP